MSYDKVGFIRPIRDEEIIPEARIQSKDYLPTPFQYWVITSWSNKVCGEKEAQIGKKESNYVQRTWYYTLMIPQLLCKDFQKK